MNIYCFEFPIDNHYRDDVFFKRIYFQGSRCPKHEEVVNALLHLAREDKKYEEEGFELCDENQQCLNVIQNIRPDIDGRKIIPYLYSNLVATNTFCDHPKWGMQPLSVKKISPIEFENPSNSVDLLGGKTYSHVQPPNKST